MGVKYAVNVCYMATAYRVVELPFGKSWNDVEDWNIKWDRLYIKFKDGTLFETNLDTQVLNALEYKRPVSAEVYPVTADNQPAWDEEVANSGG